MTLSPRRQQELRTNPCDCDCGNREERAFIAQLVLAKAARIEWRVLRSEAEAEWARAETAK